MSVGIETGTIAERRHIATIITLLFKLQDDIRRYLGVGNARKAQIYRSNMRSTSRTLARMLRSQESAHLDSIFAAIPSLYSENAKNLDIPGFFEFETGTLAPFARHAGELVRKLQGTPKDVPHGAAQITSRGLADQVEHLTAVAEAVKPKTVSLDDLPPILREGLRTDAKRDVAEAPAPSSGAN